MSDKVYDVPPEKQKILLENAKRRLELRNKFLKLSTDPFKQATGEGGHVVSIFQIVTSILTQSLIFGTF
ncbi:hypothetical protein HHI36_011879 [Cryptolaemus montrouzieri]|uniref:Complex I-B15 n=1 Tax=Cryptolaemus montrouzieri TaxID=559131 RepID=A0ABD2NDM8_9CUCU